MADRKRTQLRGADGTVLGDIEPPPSVVKDFIQIWINWFSNLHTYIGIVNENFFTVEDWNTPSLINSWADGGTDPGYYIDPFGRVWLKGDFTTGTSGTVAFNLPSGYRPPQDMYFPILLTSAATGGYILIDTGGDVYITRGAAATATLNGISFRI